MYIADRRIEGAPRRHLGGLRNGVGDGKEIPTRGDDVPTISIYAFGGIEPLAVVSSSIRFQIRVERGHGEVERWICAVVASRWILI